jgi:phage shock protein C
MSDPTTGPTGPTPGATTPPPAPASTPTPPPAPTASGPKRLYRSRNDRMISGLCAGVADYLGVDPTLVRVLTVLSLFLPGPQILAYLIGWIIVPEEPLA